MPFVFKFCFWLFRLPRKTDMERKIEIYNFSARTRQLYVRLLALVKWANSASKVDKSAVKQIVIYPVITHIAKFYDLLMFSFTSAYHGFLR